MGSWRRYDDYMKTREALPPEVEAVAAMSEEEKLAWLKAALAEAAAATPVEGDPFARLRKQYNLPTPKR